MARPEGFEPPTNGFGSHYSIRLSYGRFAMVPRMSRGAHSRTEAGETMSYERDYVSVPPPVPAWPDGPPEEARGTRGGVDVRRAHAVRGS